MQLQEKMNKKGLDKTLIALMITLFIGYVLIHDILGGTLFSYCDWDSYSLQALAWRKGQLCLDENYSWLELAAYNGNYYVSFPPVPSLVMFPLTFLFDEVPSNFVIACYAMASVAIAYKIFDDCGFRRVDCAVWSVVTVMGSNMMWMSTIGGVWFLAQGLNMVLCLAAVRCILKNKRYLTFIFLALAVGCRPFSALYFIVALIIFIKEDMETMRFRKASLSQLKYLAAPAVIALAYMAYNYVRFDNPLEFGHNYLPEFIEAKDGQFSIHYLGTNLYNLFLRPVTFEDGRLSFPQYDGFLFYIANPIFIIWFMNICKDIRKRQLTFEKISIIALIFVNIILLCMHKTLGGWQFGARYTVDMIPFVILYFMLGQKRRFSAIEYAIGAFAVLFNVYGMMAMHLFYQ